MPDFEEVLANYYAHAKLLGSNAIVAAERPTKFWWLDWWVETKNALKRAYLLFVWRSERDSNPR
jgi:hypothetical protein